jgi:hypothetical protein
MPAARKRPSAPKRRRPPTPRSAPPAALDRGAARQVAATLVGNVWAQAQAGAAEKRQELADWWAKVVEEEKAAYLDETGQPMPMNLDEIKVSAVAEGRARGLPASSNVIGDYTAADVHGMQLDRRQCEERLAEKVVKAMAAADPATLVDRYQRAVDVISTVSKKILRVMLDNGATSSGDRITRAQIAEWSGLDDGKVKRRIEGEIRRTGLKFGFKIIDAVSAGGSWLMPEGIEVARRVSPKILT